MSAENSKAPGGAAQARLISGQMRPAFGVDASSEEPSLASYGVLAKLGLAVGTVAAALVLTATIEPLRDQPPTILFFAAVVLTSWYAGERAGLVATLLSILALHFLSEQLVYDAFHVQLLNNSVNLLTFAGATWLVSILQNRWRRTHRTLVTVEHELQIARRIQQRFFPSRPPALAGLDFGGACFPAEATGGDFFDYIPIADGCLGIAIGDVTGHGVGSSLVMALIRAYLRAMSLGDADPGVILTETNRLVYHDTAEECFATAFLAHVDPRTNALRYASAGHRGYLLDGAGELQALESTGLPLAVEEDTEIVCGTAVQLQPGRILVLFSDGVTEAVSADGRPFGADRAIDVVQTRRQRPAQEIVAALYRAACDFSGNAKQEDDMTIVIVKTVDTAR